MKTVMTMNRRQFVKAVGMAGGLAGMAGCHTLFTGDGPASYEVAILGDTHFDAEPESVYHSHYDESNKWAEVQHKEFRRNGEMWRKRCRDLLASSARLAHERDTRFILQMGDIIQGDCDDVPTHKKMLDDCIKMLRTPYPAGLPFLTVVGNHDFRGKGAVEAYFQFAEPFMSRELGKQVKYPAFSFRQGKDLWVFCHFETKDLQPIIDLIEAEPNARYTFLVTHGPFTAMDCNSFRWRLGGRPECEALRPRLYELLSRRHAVVLSGHSHTTTYWRHENKFGGFCEFTSNSVWSSQELATTPPMFDDPKQYGALYLNKHSGKKLEDFKRELEFFRPGLKEYYFSMAAGHCRLSVSDAQVSMDFYPGDALVPASTFRLA